MRKQRKELTSQERKELFLFILPHLRYNVSEACRYVRVGRTTPYYWLESDPEFAEKFQAAQDAFVDYLEEKQLELIEAGDGAQLRFALNAKGRSRGYGKNVNEHKYPDGLPPANQHLHLHLPPQPKTLADWQAQVIEAREVRQLDDTIQMTGTSSSEDIEDTEGASQDCPQPRMLPGPEADTSEPSDTSDP